MTTRVRCSRARRTGRVPRLDAREKPARASRVPAPRRDVTATFTLDTYALTVTKSGTGTGTVTSNPAGITCGADCTETYAHGQTVTLTATAATGSTFTSWSGCTTTAGTTCTVSMTQARTVTATFEVMTHELLVEVSGFGTVSSPALGIDCSDVCSYSYDHDQVVTLEAVADTATAATLSRFAGWEGACSGMGSCTVTLDQARSVIARFELEPNVMFVTSAMFTGNLGGLEGADEKCQQLAAEAGLVGHEAGQNETFRAWLSTRDETAATRMGDASGWVRTDGKPVLHTIQDLAINRVIYPPRLDENGMDIGDSPLVWTGTTREGLSGGTCLSLAFPDSYWRTTEGTGIVGSATRTSSALTSLSQASCAQTARLYCMGIDRKAPVTAPGADGRLAFASRQDFVPGTGGLDKADSICQAEADEAGLPGSYKALLATAGHAPIERFQPGKRWVRVGDRVPLTEDPDGLFRSDLSFLDTAPNVLATGTRIDGFRIWTGSEGPARPGLSNSTCADWNGTGGEGLGGQLDETEMSRWFGDPGSSGPCTSFRRVICLQE